MKKLLFAGLFWCSASFGQTSLVVWSVSGVTEYASADSAIITNIELDASIGRNYLEIHGAVRNSLNALIPVSGSCFSNIAGGAICEFSARHITYVMQIDDSLNGQVTVLGSNGQIIDTGTVTFASSN